MASLLGKCSLLGHALNLSVATIGVGILALPSTFEDCGIFLVVLFIAVVGVFTVLSIDYLVLCVECLQVRSYEEIARELLGRTFEESVRWMLIVNNTGAAAGYIVVIREILTSFAPAIGDFIPFLNTPARVTFVVWALLMLPLSCVSRLSSLRIVSASAIVATFFISGVVAWRYFVPLGPEHESRSGSKVAGVRFVPLSNRLLLGLPILIFSFDCQTLVFQIYGSLVEKSRKSMSIVATTSLIITGLIYGIVGLFGYLSHTPHVHGNILTNYDPTRDTTFAVGELMYSITVTTAYALVLFPARDALLILFHGYRNVAQDHLQSLLHNKDSLLLSLLLSVSSLLLALKMPGIVFVIALLGGLCSGTMCFTYPAAFRIRLHALGIHKASTTELFMAFAMLALGIIGALMSTAAWHLQE